VATGAVQAPPEGAASSSRKQPIVVGESKECRAKKLWSKAFMKLKEDGEVHHDNLPQALELAGFLQPDKRCMADAFADVSPHYTTLDEEQFQDFIRRYTKRLDKAYMEAFKEYDADGSGEVESAELALVLQNFGIMPLRHVLDEVLSEVDEEGKGALNMAEFKKLMEIIRLREGFTKVEYESFHGLFHRFDLDKSGEIDTKELQSLLSWMGYPTAKEEVAKIVRAVDSNRSGTVSLGEMLVCMRKVREHEMNTISEAIKRWDADDSGAVSGQELQKVLSVLGYQPDPDVVREVARDMGLDFEEGGMDLSDIVRLLTIYREREGFLSSQVAEIGEAFVRFDTEKAGEIGSQEVGRVLRWLGYTTPYEVQQTILPKVDIDGSGALSLPELLKLLRMVQARELQDARKVYESLDPKRLGYLSMDDATEGFKRLKCEDSEGRVPKVLPQDLYRGPLAASEEGERRVSELHRPHVSREGFIHTVVLCQREARRVFKDNGGFSVREFTDMKKRFGFFDKDGSGEISNKELIALIEQIFPTMASDAGVRPRLRQMLAEVGDGSASLSFGDFMRLMAGLRDLEQKDHHAKELKAVEDTGFSSKEVDEFRELFLSAGNCCSTLDFKELCDMLRAICPLGDKNVRELRAHWQDVTGRQMEPLGVGQDSINVHGAELDFPEYLRLMHRLMEVDFASLKARIGG